MKEIRIQDKIYLASILDNSSVLMIAKVTPKQYSLKLGLQRLGDNSLPDWCYHITGVGKIFSSKHKRGMTYNWQVYKREDIQDILRTVFPFLKSKKKKIAELMINFNITNQEEMAKRVAFLRKK